MVITFLLPEVFLLVFAVVYYWTRVMQAAHQVGLAAVKLHRQSPMGVAVLERMQSHMSACVDKAKLRMVQVVPCRNDILCL